MRLYIQFLQTGEQGDLIPFLPPAGKILRGGYLPNDLHVGSKYRISAYFYHLYFGLPQQSNPVILCF